jgi:ribonuclease Z
MQKTFQITILGSSAATPTSLRHTTAQLLQYHNKRFLLDCAEGTQMQLRRYKVPVMGINHVFISHLHGDHYLGLAGLLFSMHLLGRKKEINIYSPPGLKEIIHLQYEVSSLKPMFEAIFHEVTDGKQLIHEDRHITVESIAMKHRIPCYGYLFREKASERNIKKEAIEKYNIPIHQMQNIKNGMDFITPNGVVIPNSGLTNEPSAPRSYAFCSDTGYTETFLEQIRGVDLMYHEATFLKDRAETAREKTHSTTVEAATIARKAGAGKLLMGHYSARYKDLSLFQKEAQEVFPNSILVQEGDVITIESKG